MCNCVCLTVAEASTKYVVLLMQVWEVGSVSFINCIEKQILQKYQTVDIELSVFLSPDPDLCLDHMPAISWLPTHCTKT